MVSPTEVKYCCSEMGSVVAAGTLTPFGSMTWATAARHSSSDTETEARRTEEARRPEKLMGRPLLLWNRGSHPHAAASSRPRRLQLGGWAVRAVRPCVGAFPCAHRGHDHVYQREKDGR